MNPQIRLKTLFVVVAVAALACWGIVLYRGSEIAANRLFSAALDESGSHNDRKAIEMFDRYLARFPDHERVSQARARRAFLRIRLQTEQSKVPTRALELAEEIVPDILAEDTFYQVVSESELNGLTWKMARKFAKRASQTTDSAEKERMVGLIERTIRLAWKLPDVYFTPAINNVPPPQSAGDKYIRLAQQRLKRIDSRDRDK